MKRLLISLLPMAGLLSGPVLAADLVYTNNGQTFNPHINAKTVINLGILQASTVQPYETYSTEVFTNAGTMLGSVGFVFQNVSPDSPERRLASIFVNENPGYIDVFDPTSITPPATSIPCVVATVDPSYLWILATNIITGAGVPTLGSALTVGANGEIRLVGTNVNLSWSGLQVAPVWSQAQGTSTIGDPPTEFRPDVAVYDRYALEGSFSPQNSLSPAGLWDGSVATPQNPSPADAQAFIPVLADSYINTAPNSFANLVLTNVTGDLNDVQSTNIELIPISFSTNIAKGALFVGAPPEFSVSGGFSGASGNLSASVVLQTLIPNPVTEQLETATIYIQDSFPTGTRGLLANVIGCPPTGSRPLAYTVDRQTTVAGSPGNNGVPDPDFFTTSSQLIDDTNVLAEFTQNPVIDAGDYTAYSPFFDNVVSRLPDIPAGSATNLPGRVRIFAHTLDLTETRIRGEGEIFIKSSNLISSTNTVIDAENLRFNLDASDGSLLVQNLSKDNIARLRGAVRAWTAVWEDTIEVRLNNYIITNGDIVTTDPPVPPATNEVVTTNMIAVFSPITNTIAVQFAVTMVDANGLQTLIPVNVYDFTSQTRNVVINDNMTVIERLRLLGESLTINGNLTIPGVYPTNPVTGSASPSGLALFNWTAANAPNLRHFTNNGMVQVVNLANFGPDRAPYANFVNHGVITASGISISSDYYENTGDLTAAFGGLFIQGNNGKLEGGTSLSASVSQFSGRNLKFNNYVLTAADKLIFRIRDSLSDAGPGSGNSFELQNGFLMEIKPATGDLLGTTIRSAAPLSPTIRVDHFWAGEDRGPSPAGFTNNVAIGRLVLLPQATRPLFAFSGTGARNGLYVDVLDLGAFTSPADLTNRIQINPNLVIYFAAATLGFVPPNNADGIVQQPEEYLDGLFNGRLRWVRTFAGPNSSQVTVINGQSVPVNRALLNSRIIDSDNDGVPNFFDTAPNLNDPDPDAFEIANVTLDVVGNGTIAGSPPFLVGEEYTLFAVPASGSAFAGWTGSVEESARALTFVAQSGQSFTANFVFAPVVGTYSGLFAEPGGANLLASGGFTAKVTKSGKYSAQVRFGTRKFSFTGRLDETGFDARQVRGTALFVELQAEADRITGTVTDGDWVADLIAERVVYHAKTNPAPAGRYTMVIPGSPTNSTTVPMGDGLGAVTVSTSGKVVFKGTLADGTKITQSGMLAGDGLWPFYAGLYRNLGHLFGWLSVSGPQGDIAGTLNWVREPGVSDTLYPDGFTLNTQVIGSKYDPSVAPVTGLTHGTLGLRGGNLTSDLAYSVVIGTNNSVTVVGADKASVKLVRNQGLFKGSLVDPASGGKIKINGAVLQNRMSGSGFFLGTDQSGRVAIEP